MQPSQTHSVNLPQQGLTHPAGGCHSEPRSDDLGLGGYEGANPHTGRRAANEEFGIAGTSSAAETQFSRLDAFELLMSENIKINGPTATLSDLEKPIRRCLISFGLKSKLKTLNEMQEKIMDLTIGNFISRVQLKWKACKRNKTLFKTKYEDWLSKPFANDVPPDLINETNDRQFSPTTELETPVLTEISNRKDYENLSARQKLRSRKRLQSVLEEEPQEKLIKTFCQTVTTVNDIQQSRKVASDLESVIHECLISPEKPAQILTKINHQTQPYTPEEALGLIIDRKFNVETYKLLQQDSKKRGFPLYPPYSKVMAVRESCYPDGGVTATEVEASVSFQALLIQTFKRIMSLCDDSLNHYCAQGQINELSCVFEGSWGFDGSTSQSLYKQRFDNPRDPSYDPNTIIATTYVPLRIRECGGKGHTIWMNPAPQSFRFCRPLHIQYRKETKDLIISEKEYVEEQIRNLTPIQITTSKGHKLTATCKLTLSIIDGKVYNIINNTTSQMRCPICKLTSTQFNDLEQVFSTPIIEEEALKNGISPLHAYIRCLEFLLHLGYKNDPSVRLWRVSKSSVEGGIVRERKKNIQDQIYDRMSLLIDVVRPNSGTSNDGNTARRVFATDESRQMFADILEIQKWLVDEIHIVLVAINCGLPIDSGKFGQFCRNLASKYVQEYGWCPMTTTIHKILIHGQTIMETSTLPVGLLSEQAGESRNKFWRYDREHHCRKDARQKTMRDLFHRALESSDPVVSNIRLAERQKSCKRIPLPPEVRAMLKPLDPYCLDSSMQPTDNSDDEHDHNSQACIENEENDYTPVLQNQLNLFTDD